MANRLGYRIITKRFIGHDVWDDIELISREWLEHPVETIFDVGANDGTTSLQLLKRFSPRRIHAFEPVAETFEKLHKNTEDLSTIEVHKLALSDSTGVSMINRYKGDTLASMCEKTPIMSTNSDSFVGTEAVSLVTLDDFCREKGISEIDLLKIDTEGYDKHVLIGALNMISKTHIKFIVFEFYCVGQMGGDEGNLVEADSILINHGYRFVSTYTDFVNSKVPVGVYNALYMANPNES